jgi:nicotinate-nucleotide adenylyltransferase
MSSARRLGLLGGTFDPPHLGHLVVAEVARVALSLDEVQLVVAGEPWMKGDHSAVEHRVRMVEIALDADPCLTVNRSEVDRPGVTYTVDTLVQLREGEPTAELHFLLGADAAQKLPQWKEVERSLDLATFVAVTRPGYHLVHDDPLLERVRELSVPHIDISSTDLRRRFAADEAVRYLVPPAVEAYVRERGLYGAAARGPGR